MSNEDLAALGERISRLERVVAALAQRADLAVPDLLGDAPPAAGTGFASDGAPSGFASDSASGFESLDAAQDPELLAFVQNDNLIRAIKRYRELTGSGLAEAKEAVERIAAGQR